jgi:predicted RNA-binding protein YlxR (DUF448 family)
VSRAVKYLMPKCVQTRKSHEKITLLRLAAV